MWRVKQKAFILVFTLVIISVATVLTMLMLERTILVLRVHTNYGKTTGR